MGWSLPKSIIREQKGSLNYHTPPFSPYLSFAALQRRIYTLSSLRLAKYSSRIFFSFFQLRISLSGWLGLRR